MYLQLKRNAFITSKKALKTFKALASVGPPRTHSTVT
jgi:hypothetical protein